MITDERYIALVRPAIEAREKVKPIFSGLTIEEKRQFIRLMIEHDELIVTLDVGEDDPFYQVQSAHIMSTGHAVLIWCDASQNGFDYGSRTLIPYEGPKFEGDEA